MLLNCYGNRNQADWNEPMCVSLRELVGREGIYEML
jgi:hypothetical protein